MANYDPAFFDPAFFDTAGSTAPKRKKKKMDIIHGIVGTHVQVSNSTLASALDIPTIIGDTIPADALGFWMQVNGGTVRYRLDGTAPTTSVGYLLADGDEKIVKQTTMSPAGYLSNVKIIKSTGTPILEFSLIK